MRSVDCATWFNNLFFPCVAHWHNVMSCIYIGQERKVNHCLKNTNIGYLFTVEK